MTDYLYSLVLQQELDDFEGVPAEDLDDDDRARIEAIRDLRAEVSGWEYNVSFIPEDEFEDHARQTAEDIGAINSEGGWPITCIDWERAADELRMDYTSVEFDGTTYLYRE